MALQPVLGQVLAGYGVARAEVFEGHPLAVLIRGDLAASLAEVVDDPSYLVRGGPGVGNWAETPWAAIFDPLVTTSAMKGYYVVFLFRPDGEAVYLSLNQGTTQVREEAGTAYQAVLESRATAWRGLLPDELAAGLIHGPIELGGSGWLSRGYESGSIVATRYAADDLPADEALQLEVRRYLELYRSLISSLDLQTEDADPGTGETEPSPGEEGHRVRWHRRVERNPRLTRAAKEFHGTTCKVCGFNFAERYGDIGDGFIEAHHLVPLSALEGRPKEQDPRTDFTVVCPNCHRMLHRQTPPLTPEQLTARLQ